MTKVVSLNNNNKSNNNYTNNNNNNNKIKNYNNLYIKKKRKKKTLKVEYINHEQIIMINNGNKLQVAEKSTVLSKQRYMNNLNTKAQISLKVI
jgi:hypothetical protein